MFELRFERCVGGCRPRREGTIPGEERGCAKAAQRAWYALWGGRGPPGLKCGMDEGGAAWGRDVGKGQIIHGVLDQITNVGLYPKSNGKSLLGFKQGI